MKFLALVFFLTTVTFGGPKRGVTQQVDFLFDLTDTTQTSGTYTVSALQGSLPVSGVITNMHMHVIEPLVSSDSASITIGNSASSTGYMAATLYSTLSNNYVKNAGQLGSSLLWDDSNDVAVPYLMDASDDTDLTVEVTAGSVSAGKVYFIFDYFVPTEY